MNECDRCFHSAVLSAVKAKMLFDVLAGHRFVFLCGVDIFSLCFLTGIARIRTTDFMNDAFAIGGLRQIRNSGIPLRLRQAFGIITAVQIVMTYVGGAILSGWGLVLTEWALVLAMAISIIPIDLIRKAIANSISKNK